MKLKVLFIIFKGLSNEANNTSFLGDEIPPLSRKF